MECCCHVWVGAPNCYLDMLDKLQKWVSRTVSPSASLESLAHRQNVANLSLYYRYNFGRCSSKHLNWLNWFHFFILVEGPLVILVLCMIFLRPLLHILKMSMSTVSLGILYLQNAFL